MTAPYPRVVASGTGFPTNLNSSNGSNVLNNYSSRVASQSKIMLMMVKKVKVLRSNWKSVNSLKSRRNLMKK